MRMWMLEGGGLEARALVATSTAKHFTPPLPPPHTYNLTIVIQHGRGVVPKSVGVARVAHAVVAVHRVTCGAERGSGVRRPALKGAHGEPCPTRRHMEGGGGVEGGG